MAEPLFRNGNWISAYKDRFGRWRYLTLNANSKTEAKRLNAELQLREDRIRLGIEEERTENVDLSVGELISWWIENRLKRTRGYSRCGGTVRGHILKSRLARMAPAELTPGKVEEFLSAKEDEVGPATVNHLRAYIRTAFNAAIAAERFFGPNPVNRTVTKKRKVPKRKPLYLQPAWIPRVLDNVPAHWRGAFAVGIYAGLRKGEILALRKCDVDLANRLIFVRRSHGADITKGGHEDGIPIAEELMPYLRDAIENSPGELMFPRADGTRYAEQTNLSGVLRTALRKAGLVDGYAFKCRRKGCGYQEEAEDGEVRHCPRCKMKLWAIGKPLRLRFHDTRHTTASLLLMAGASPAAVQRIMRHADIRVTVGVYGHLAPDYLRGEVDRLTFRTEIPIGARTSGGPERAVTARVPGESA